MSEFTHFDESGASRMVDVSPKAVTARLARVQGFVSLKPETLQKITAREFKKGDVLEVARLAGIMGTKQTGNLIPLCHPLPIESVTIDFSFPEAQSPNELPTIQIEATVKTEGKTGVEMEAFTAVSVTALTIYDMCKAIDREMVVGPIQLIEKSGGKSGHFLRTSSVKQSD